MILGMSLSLFTRLHVIISLIGIASGFIVIFGMFAAKRLSALTALFLATTVLTSITGFLFPIHGVTPGIVLGILSLIVLLIAIVARYSFHLSGKWSTTYVVSAVIAQYFNVFVLIAQVFQKVPAIKALAPTGSEPPFKIVMITVLLLHIVLGYLAVKKFRGEPLPLA